MKGVTPRKTLNQQNLLSRGIPRLFINASLDQYDLDRDLKKIMKKYLDNIDQMYEDNVSMMFCGGNGNGKTFCASLIIKEAYRQRYTSYITTYQHLLDLRFKDTDDAEMEISNYYEAEFLVIDELGKETKSKRSSFTTDVLEELLRVRDTKGFPTILCTNLDPVDFFERYGKSIESLVKGNYAQVFFKEGDFRKVATKQRKGMRLLMGD